jgi:hypothetical protein
MASTPAIVAAAFSKALCIQLIFHEVRGKMVVQTSRQPVALAIMIGSSVALKTILKISGIPQPRHIP